MNAPFASLIIVAQALLSIALLAAIYRLIRGPTMLNRLVGMDLCTAIVIAWLLLDQASEPAISWSPIVILAAISFIATMSFARILERHQVEDDT